MTLRALAVSALLGLLSAACHSPTVPAATPMADARRVAIAGIVREPGERPLSDVKVSATTGQSTMTDSSGRFVLESVPAFARILVEKEGYRGNSAVVNPDVSTELSFVIEPHLRVQAGEALSSTVFWDDPTLYASDDERCFPQNCPADPVGPARLIDVECRTAGMLDVSVHPQEPTLFELSVWIQNSAASSVRVRAGDIVGISIVLPRVPRGASQRFELATSLR